MGKQKQKIYNPDPKNKIKSNNWQFWAIIALPVIYAVVFAFPWLEFSSLLKTTAPVEESSEATGWA